MALRSRKNGKNEFHWLFYSRSLAELFTIDALNRIEREEMDYLKAIQRKRNYRRTAARDLINMIKNKMKQTHGENTKLGKVYFMPRTFVGSRQYYQEKYANLMTMVRRLGNPTWFLFSFIFKVFVLMVSCALGL